MKILYATVRWTVAATSANTGGYIYFRQRRKCKQVPSSVFNNISLLRRGAFYGSVMRDLNNPIATVQIAVCRAVSNYAKPLASLFEGGGTAQAVTEGVSYRKNDTPPVTLGKRDSPLRAGAKIRLYYLNRSINSNLSNRSLLSILKHGNGHPDNYLNLLLIIYHR